MESSLLLNTVEEEFGSLEVFLVENKVVGFAEVCVKATSSIQMCVKAVSSVEGNHEPSNAMPSSQGNGTPSHATHAHTIIIIIITENFQQNCEVPIMYKNI